MYNLGGTIVKYINRLLEDLLAARDKELERKFRLMRKEQNKTENNKTK